MRVILLIVISLSLQGCVGLFAGALDTYESAIDEPRIESEKHERKAFYLNSDPLLSKQQLLTSWGQPDEEYAEGNCDVLVYHNGYNWEAIGIFFIFVPVGIPYPTGIDEQKFYFINEHAVGLIEEYSELSHSFGYFCGSNECQANFGRVNRELSKKVDATWCY